MDQQALINEAAMLINEASANQSKGFAVDAMTKLVSLRELLNNQPDLEAGGATETPEQTEPTS